MIASFVLSCIYSVVVKNQTVAQPCKMLWRVGNPTIAQPWKMLWGHMLAGPPHLHQNSYDSVVYLICLTACKETRQSAQTWKPPWFIANKHGSDSVGGSAGAGRGLGAARSPLFWSPSPCHVLNIIEFVFVIDFSIVMKPDSRTNVEAVGVHCIFVFCI